MPTQTTANQRKSISNTRKPLLVTQAQIAFALNRDDWLAFTDATMEAITERMPMDTMQNRQLRFAAMFTLFKMQLQGLSTTTVDIAKITGCTLPYAPRMMKPLVNAEMVTVIETGNTATLSGRGRLNNYYISDSLIARTKALRAEESTN